MNHPVPSTTSAYQPAATFTRVDSASGQSAKGKFKSRQIAANSQAQQLIRSEEKLFQLRKQLSLLEHKLSACLNQQPSASVGQNSQWPETHTTTTPGKASSTLQVPQTSTISPGTTITPSATQLSDSSMAVTTTTDNVTIAPLSQSVTDKPLSNITQSFTDSTKAITRLFNEGIEATRNQTLTHIQQLPTADQQQHSIQKRIALGDGLNSFKGQFSDHFLDIFQLAHNASQSIRSIATDDDQSMLSASSGITSTLISSFQNMYTAMENLRLQLFVDANYIDSQWLSGGDSRQPEAADNQGRNALAGDNLVKAIKQQPSSQSPDSFDRFMVDMGLLLESQDKIRQLHQAETESTTSNPVARQQEQLWAAAMKFTRAEISRTLVADPDRAHNQQVLTDILQREKGLFIDDVQQIHLNHGGRFDGEITRAEAGPDVLFLPSTFLDVIRDPDGYRSGRPNKPAKDLATSAGQSHGPMGHQPGNTTASLEQPDTGRQTSGDTAANTHTGNYRLSATTIKQFVDKALHNQSRFNQGIAGTYHQALAQIRQLAGPDTNPGSIKKRIILGDTLNRLNNQFSDSFRRIFQSGDQSMNTLSSLSDDDTQPIVTGKALIRAQLTDKFIDMYATLNDVRRQLFFAAGYSDKQTMSAEDIRQLASGTDDRTGRNPSASTHLIKVLLQQPTASDPDDFDLFMTDLTLALEGRDERSQLQQAETESGTDSPVLQARESLWSAAMNTNSSRQVDSDLLAKPQSSDNQPLLDTVLRQEKELFIDDLQKTYLRNHGHGADEVAPGEAGQDVLYLPSTFMDVIKDPDGYRAELPKPVNLQPASSRNQSHPRKRRDLSGQPTISGASQHKGMLAGAVQTLGQLAGYLNPLSLRGSAPPAINGNLQQSSNAILTPANYPVAGTLMLANLLAAKVSGRPLLPQHQGVAADNSQSARLIGQRLNATNPIDHLPAKTVPLTRELASGNYDKAQSGFMKLPLSEQLELLVLLDKQPDHLGQDSCSGPLRQLQADARSLAAANTGEIGTRTPDWQSFRLSQRAWQLFTNLHDTRVEALGEAINQQKITKRIIREGIEQNQDNAHYLGQLVVQLLPHRTSASEQANLMATGTESMPTVAGLHRFTTKGITDILSSYRTIKSLVSEHFPQLFGNTVNDPQLQNELIAQIARTSLQELRGKTTADGWQQVVRDNMLAEFEEWL
ncbi:hypothetical protein [Salinisphaera sp. G21_0]|uniref:hypothetical protein n=1 Tax=Salinisphaera sp. G21_0 TaxID=2821094 RepID=UPI001ADCEDD2|nr:hypothetical protein [Salinisphaera sp. G21_0]MBO9480766.1 hypothetical protein [Salinisphaera sp. G21_0]